MPSGLPRNVGCRAVAVFDTLRDLAVPAWLLYPTDEPARGEHVGPYELELARDANVAGAGLPLVVISHGNGSTPWVHRRLATQLVRCGFVVAVLEHPGNNRKDNSLSDPAGVAKLANLENRPRHVRLVIDAALADPHVGPRLAPGVAVVGESIGGYTALAIAGGHAMTLPDDVGPAQRLAPDAETRRRAFPVETERDPRVRAIVLLSPAVFWFMADGALADVTIPILVRTGERDPLCPPALTERVLRGVPDPARVHHTVVPDAAHFSFQSPYPPVLAGPGFAPSIDPPGFDRASYQGILLADVVTFLREALGAST
jgi:predicted dienelactone hydrolase